MEGEEEAGGGEEPALLGDEVELVLLVAGVEGGGEEGGVLLHLLPQVEAHRGQGAALVPSGEASLLKYDNFSFESGVFVNRKMLT